MPGDGPSREFESAVAFAAFMADEALDAAVAETQKLLGAQIQKVTQHIIAAIKNSNLVVLGKPEIP
jgi:hypothetical protein